MNPTSRATALAHLLIACALCLGAACGSEEASTNNVDKQNNTTTTNNNTSNTSNATTSSNNNNTTNATTNTTTMAMAPRVASSFPSNNAEGIAPNLTIQIVFDQPIDQASVNKDTITLTQGDSNIGLGAFAFPKADTAEIKLVQPLSVARTYTLTITTGVTSSDGTPLEQETSVRFTTEADMRFLLRTSSPSNNDQGVAVNAKLSFTFSAPINPTTFDGALVLRPEDDPFARLTYTYEADGPNVSVTPDQQFELNRAYQATIFQTLEDDMGRTLASQAVVKFVVGSDFNITASSIPNNATEVAVEDSIVLTFSEPIDPASSNNTAVRVVPRSWVESRPGDSEAIAGTVSVQGNEVTFTPDNGWLEYKTQYLVTLDLGAFKSMGGKDSASYRSAFTTLMFDPDFLYTFHNSAGARRRALGLDGTASARMLNDYTGDLAKWYVSPNNMAGFSTIQNAARANTASLRSNADADATLEDGTTDPKQRWRFVSYNNRFDVDTDQKAGESARLYYIESQADSDTQCLAEAFNNGDMSYRASMTPKTRSSNQLWWFARQEKR